VIQKNKTLFSVVVPVYNSEGSLRVLYARLKNVFHSLNSDWELILVNDASADNSWKVMRELAKEDAGIIAINLSNNFGQHNALMCGFSYANGDYIITMDDDLQHPPEEIPKLIKTAIDGDYGVVYGQYLAQQYGWFRALCSNWIHGMISGITGSGYKTTSFRIIKNSVVKKMVGFGQHNIMIDVLIRDIVNKSEVGHCAVEHQSREIGKSNYSFRKLLKHTVNMIFNYTLWPLRFAAVSGFVFSFISILLGTYYFVAYIFYGAPVRGWTSLMVAVAFFSGVTLFVLGIIGEYMGRIFLNINHKPQYIIKEIYKKGENHND
jgi:glycosyltransferase involved in cell wall biosynthesis